jgi:hypothetical protein
MNSTQKCEKCTMHVVPLRVEIHVISSAAIRQSALLYHARHNRQACSEYATALSYRNSHYPNRISVVLKQLRISTKTSKVQVAYVCRQHARSESWLPFLESFCQIFEPLFDIWWESLDWGRPVARPVHQRQHNAEGSGHMPVSRVQHTNELIPKHVKALSL